MSEVIKWENAFLVIPATAELVPVLNKAGEEGWEAWAVIGIDQETNSVRIAMKRIKRLVSLATEMPKGNGVSL